jgi:chemotaxis protein MotB
VQEASWRSACRGDWGCSLKKGAQPIVIVRKKGEHHDDEHGGAWKVAYADFVTAMMALFIVLWLLSASEKVQKAVGGYFQDPTGKGRQTGSTSAGVGETLTLTKDQLQEIKEKLQQAMKQIPAFKDMQNQIKMTITAEGLRIDLLETKRGLFFETGNPTPTPAGGELLKVLATELAKLPNKIVIEGHTDSTPYGRPDYSNWELSADRANAARRILSESGLEASRISQVRGFADQRLLLKDDPTNPSNRRISIIVRNQGLDAQEEQVGGAQPGAPAAAPKPATPEKAAAVMLPATAAKK